MNVIEVRLWGQTLGALAWNEETSTADFEYSEEFLKTGIKVNPMAQVTHITRGVKGETYKGLPPFIAESLPDNFGSGLINAYFARKGQHNINVLDKLCYVGEKGMGAMTFHPTSDNETHEIIHLRKIVEQAKLALSGNLNEQPSHAIDEIISVGVSAGGARAKAIIAYNEETGEIKSGIKSYKGFTDLIIKFDGVSDNQRKKPEYGRIEYAYYLMAKAAGINMSKSKLIEEGESAHFITERFDRVCGEKLHMLSLCGMSSLDFRLEGAHSYEQYFSVVRDLLTDSEATQEAIRRCVFNVLSANPDDHTKNVSFLMSKDGLWSLAPAYDMTYSFNQSIPWTHNHQMSVNGKTSNITKEDLIISASKFIKRDKAEAVLNKVIAAINDWHSFADKAGVSEAAAVAIEGNQLSVSAF